MMISSVMAGYPVPLLLTDPKCLPTFLQQRSETEIGQKGGKHVWGSPLRSSGQYNAVGEIRMESLASQNSPPKGGVER